MYPFGANADHIHKLVAQRPKISKPELTPRNHIAGMFGAACAPRTCIVNIAVRRERCSYSAENRGVGNAGERTGVIEDAGDRGAACQSLTGLVRAGVVGVVGGSSRFCNAVQLVQPRVCVGDYPGAGIGDCAEQTLLAGGYVAVVTVENLVTLEFRSDIRTKSIRHSNLLVAIHIGANLSTDYLATRDA